MRFWTIAYPDENGNDVFETLSDAEIIASYWDHWYGKMCAKFGKDHVDSHYCQQDCIDDWVIVHWATESKDD
jgi:hypothetical protein